MSFFEENTGKMGTIEYKVDSNTLKIPWKLNFN